MEIDFNGTPATIDIPEGYIALDALILVRAVNMNNPAEGIVSIGSTDHTDPHHPRRHRLILRKVPDDDRSARRGRLMPAHRICAQGCGNPAVWGSVCMECAQTPNRFDPTVLEAHWYDTGNTQVSMGD